MDAVVGLVTQAKTSQQLVLWAVYWELSLGRLFAGPGGG